MAPERLTKPKKADIPMTGMTCTICAATIEKVLAQAIIRAAKERRLELYPAADFNAIPGHGIKALVARQRLILGNLYGRHQFITFAGI